MIDEFIPLFEDGEDYVESEELIIKREIISLFRYEYQKVFIRSISSFYPLNEYLLRKYEEEWCWNLISSNSHIPISLDLLNVT